MEIKIVKNIIYGYAMALTARAGAATDAYSQIAITKDNYPMLDVYLTEAIVQAESSLRKKLAGSNNLNMQAEGEYVTIRIKDQDMSDEAVHNLVESGIRLYMAYHIAASWLQTSPASGLADSYGTTAAVHLQAALSALNQKIATSIADADYEDRENDNAFARPGMRITDNEVLMVQAEDDPERMEPAVTLLKEHLTSNP